MKAKRLLIATLLALAPVLASTASTESLELPAGFHYPNGIARTADGTLWVGLITEGRILRRAPAGQWEALEPNPDKVFAGTALRLDEGRRILWGASPDFLPAGDARPHRLFALDTATGKILRVLDLPDGGFGNDIALEPDGGVLLTDSYRSRVLRLAPGAPAFETLVEDQRLGPVNGIGAAGIVRAEDGRLVLGNFGSGRLYILDGNELKELELPRRLENPDGLALLSDGSLLVLECAIASGNGKLLRVTEPFAPGMRTLQTLVANLEAPVNLSVAPDDRIFVSESRIRHRLIEGLETPTTFRILSLSPPADGP